MFLHYNKCTHPYSTNIVEEVDTITNKSDSTPTSETIKVIDIIISTYVMICFSDQSLHVQHTGVVYIKECTHNYFTNTCAVDAFCENHFNISTIHVPRNHPKS